MRKGRTGRKNRVSRSGGAKAQSPRRERAVQTRPPASVTSVPAPVSSIPPASDLAVEVSAPAAFGVPAARFFSEGDLAQDDEDAHDGPLDAKAARKNRPEVALRRARFARYVTWAVGMASVVCVVAILRGAAEDREMRARAAASTASTTAPASPTVEPPPLAMPLAMPIPAAQPVPAAVVEAPKAAAAPSDETPRDTPAKTAKEEKADAQRALERRQLEAAVAAGERAVLLDPTDGDAWLLLGAAHQERGNMTEARRAYSSCVKEGKRGAVGECRAMLR